MKSMNAKWTIILAALLISAMFFAGCAKTETEKQAIDETPVKVEFEETKAEVKVDADIPVAEKDEGIVTAKEPKPVVTCSNPAPSFSLRGVNGEKVSLSDYTGKVVLIDFWATWCSPCRMAIPDLVALQNEYGADDFVIIGVSLDREPSMVPRFVQQAGINYVVAYGFGESIAMDYGNITSIPTAVIVDRNGCIKQRLVGLHPKNELKKLITPLIGESA
jgi:thiol-disulfide isomerase/thioredoxin